MSLPYPVITWPVNKYARYIQIPEGYFINIPYIGIK